MPPDNLQEKFSGMPTIIKGPDHVEVNIERSVNLQCRAVGHPVPTVTWARNGVNIEQLGERFVQLADGSLLIKSTKFAFYERKISRCSTRRPRTLHMHG